MQMLRILCVFHKKCDKWADHGKQLKPSQVDSYYVLKKINGVLDVNMCFVLPLILSCARINMIMNPLNLKAIFP